MDEAGRNQLAPRLDARVRRPGVRRARVHDALALEDDAALLVHLVTPTVPRHDPAALDHRAHTLDPFRDPRGAGRRVHRPHASPMPSGPQSTRLAAYTPGPTSRRPSQTWPRPA